MGTGVKGALLCGGNHGCGLSSKVRQLIMEYCWLHYLFKALVQVPPILEEGWCEVKITRWAPSLERKRFHSETCMSSP